jgi:ATP-dependent helicase HrpB
MQETPRIGPDNKPLVIHLLAPNHRAVQTTTDLAGFWERLYPQVRRELMRRYPKHQWPETPHALKGPQNR